MTDDRDARVAEALRELPVPDHAPDFWASLERRLADEPAPRGVAFRAGAAAPVRPSPAGASPLAEIEEGDDAPVVVSLAERRPATPRVLPLLSVAAVLVAVLAVAVNLTRDDDAPRVRAAGPGETATSTTPTTSGPVTTTAAPPAGAATPEGALLAWIEAVGAGDVDAAIALTGPRSAAYADALTGGAGLEGFIIESGEGYGAWAASPDRKTTAVALATSAGEEISVVILSGTWTGEGGTGFRTDAIPTVRGSRGGWLVEPWAIEPKTGGRIEVLSPSPAEEHGFNGLAPDESLAAAAPGSSGTFHFSLDRAPATAVPGTRGGASGVQATFDPPGDLPNGTHLFLIAFVEGNTISTIAGTFVVEG